MNGEMMANEYGAIVQSCWDEISRHFLRVRLDAFVLMPNHIHSIIVISDRVGAIHELPLQKLSQQRDERLRIFRRRMLVPKVVGHIKMNTAKRINASRGTPGIPLWQRNYYEHIIRNENELHRIREYIQTNPLRWEFDRENPARQGEDEFDRWLTLRSRQGDSPRRGNS
jgi:Transposase and inactivated derivatives